MTEQWRPVADWPYEVSDLGRVRRATGWNGTQAGRVLNPARCGRYALVSLRNKGRVWAVHVHTLVAAAFLGPRPAGQQVNHKDGDKRNNRSDNLEYTTMPANMRHAVENALVRQGERHPRAKLTADDVAEIRRLHAAGVSQADIARRFGRHPATVNHVVRGRHWRREVPA